jgi:predicted ATP-dependent endonuclease of OLD family
MKDMGLEVANSLIPKVSSKSLDSLFSFSLESDDGIALNKRGSGFRRMVLLNYFRAEAERKIVEKNNKNVIYAIEEPETAQHPNHQKMLIEALIELSMQDNHQIIITTHTPEIAKMVDENNLIIIKKDENNNSSLIENHDDKLKAIVETLGIHPFFSSKVVVCVEGEYDIKFLTNVNQAIDEYKNIIESHLQI